MLDWLCSSYSQLSPLLLIGALGIGFATVMAANYQLRIVSTLIVISASLSFLAGIAEQLSINQRHLSELHRNPAPEIAAGIFISVGAFFKYLFLFFRLEPNFQHRRPSYLKTTQFSSTISSRSHWNRGNLIRKVYLILSLVVIVLIAILEASWRTAFALRSQSFASLSRVSASLQIIFLIWASIKIVFLATRYSSPDATVISTLKDLGSLVTGNAIGLANQILSLETIGFLESPVGRLLELYQMYLYLFDASFYCTRIASMNSVGFVSNRSTRQISIQRESASSSFFALGPSSVEEATKNDFLDNPLVQRRLDSSTGMSNLVRNRALSNDSSYSALNRLRNTSMKSPSPELNKPFLINNPSLPIGMRNTNNVLGSQKIYTETSFKNPRIPNLAALRGLPTGGSYRKSQYPNDKSGEHKLGGSIKKLDISGKEQLPYNLSLIESYKNPLSSSSSTKFPAKNPKTDHPVRTPIRFINPFDSPNSAALLPPPKTPLPPLPPESEIEMRWKFHSSSSPDGENETSTDLITGVGITERSFRKISLPKSLGKSLDLEKSYYEITGTQEGFFNIQNPGALPAETYQAEISEIKLSSNMSHSRGDYHTKNNFGMSLKHQTTSSAESKIDPGLAIQNIEIKISSPNDESQINSQIGITASSLGSVEINEGEEIIRSNSDAIIGDSFSENLQAIDNYIQEIKSFRRNSPKSINASSFMGTLALKDIDINLSPQIFPTPSSYSIISFELNEMIKKISGSLTNEKRSSLSSLRSSKSARELDIISIKSGPAESPVGNIKFVEEKVGSAVGQIVERWNDSHDDRSSINKQQKTSENKELSSQVSELRKSSLYSSEFGLVLYPQSVASNETDSGDEEDDLDDLDIEARESSKLEKRLAK